MSLLDVALILVLAAVAPVVGLAVPWRLAPDIVIEILLGLALGPYGLGWFSVDAAADTLALFGLAFLFFLAGLEIDLVAIRGALLVRSLGGYVCGLSLALAVTAVLHSAGVIPAPGLLAVALSATGLGLVVPLLRDAHLMATPSARRVVAASSVAEFAAVVILALAFGSGHSPVLNASLLALLVAITLAVTMTGLRLSARGAVTSLVDRLSNGTTQLRVRLSVGLVIGFAAVAQRAGLEVVLGAFFAGAILNVLDAGMHDRAFRGRLDGIGYGFLIPIFFIVSGARLDLSALRWWPEVLVVVPVLTLTLLAARGLPAVLLGLESRRATVGAGLLCATSLPFIVTATQLGLEQGRLDPASAAAITAAGLVGVCVFPALGLWALRHPASDQTGDSRASAAAPSR